MTTKRRRTWTFRLLGIAGGILLMIPSLLPAAAPLQLVALLPVFYAAARAEGWRQALTAGMYMGVAYVLPQAIVLLMGPHVALALLVHLTALAALLVLASWRLLAKATVTRCLAVGAALALMDWVNFTVVPLWGEAQSIARPWSSYPSRIAFTCYTGITGIAFVLGALQALAVSFVLRPAHRLRGAAAAVCLVALVVAANLAARRVRPVGRLKVAAVGWTTELSTKFGDANEPDQLQSLFRGPAAEAAKRGARLVVWPEVAFAFHKSERQEYLERFAAVAMRWRIFLAVGYFDSTDQENRVAFIGPAGELLAEYTKTHLTPYEHYTEGTGAPAVIQVDGVAVGGMICQDDNFTDLSRSYGRMPVGVVAVPTLDWWLVKGAHLQSSIHRAVESRYAVVRAARSGVSAIISPTGEVLARRDHFRDGAGLVVADVGVYAERTLFSRLGHWPVVPYAALLAACGAVALLRRRRGGRDGDGP